MKSLVTWLKEQIAPDVGCFIFRPVLNAQLLAYWAQNQNIGGKYTAPDKMHVTIMHSKVDIRGHKNFKLSDDEGIIEPQDYAGVLQRLGSDGAVVLKFQCPGLFERWRELIEMGAIWSFPTYVPHVTLSYKTPESGWWTTVIPAPNFPLWLGPEQVEDLKE